MVHADFEACTKPISDCEPISDGSFTKKHQKHKPCGFCYHIACFSDKLYSQGPVIYRENSEDEDVAQTFVEMPEKNIKNIHKEFDFAMKMIFDQEERLKFRAEVCCWIYKGSFDNNREVSWSNSSHLFLKNLGKSEGNIKCIPDNEEKYIHFTEDVVVANFRNKEGKEVEVKSELCFIDSFKFMASFLEKYSFKLCGSAEGLGRKAVPDPKSLPSRGLPLRGLPIVSCEL